MRVLVFINHPAQVHLHKNIIWKLQKDGHTVEIMLREKDVARALLDRYGFKYNVVGNAHRTLIGKAYELISTDFNCFKVARKFAPDILLDVGIYGAHTAKLVGKPSITFMDSDKHTEIVDLLTIPFTAVVITQTSSRKNFAMSDKKAVRVNTFKEMAYLHPNWFKPDRSVLDDVGIPRDEQYALLRFVSFTAYHDSGVSGLDIASKRRLINQLKDHNVRPYISSEMPLPEEFEKYRLPFSPEKLHHFLYYAKIFIGESQTMTTEAACLGVPAIKFNSFAVDDDINFVELENDYHAIFKYDDPAKVIDKLSQLLQIPDLKEQWVGKRRRILADKIDLTSFMVWFIENYPQSVQEMRKNPDIANRYKGIGIER